MRVGVRRESEVVDAGAEGRGLEAVDAGYFFWG